MTGKRKIISGERACPSAGSCVEQCSGLCFISLTTLIVNYMVQNQIASSLYQSWCQGHDREDPEYDIAVRFVFEMRMLLISSQHPVQPLSRFCAALLIGESI